MNKILVSCKRCLNPYVIGLLLILIIALIIFIPIIGFASLVAVLPLIGCTVMCGGMAFMMGKKK